MTLPIGSLIAWPQFTANWQTTTLAVAARGPHDGLPGDTSIQVARAGNPNAENVVIDGTPQESKTVIGGFNTTTWILSTALTADHAAGSLVYFQELWTVLPTGWLECDGRWLVAASYPDLFAAILGDYGYVPNPVEQFRIPDLRGQTVPAAVVDRFAESGSHEYRVGFTGGYLDPQLGTGAHSHGPGNLQADSDAGHHHGYDISNPLEPQPVEGPSLYGTGVYGMATFGAAYVASHKHPSKHLTGEGPPGEGFNSATHLHGLVSGQSGATTPGVSWWGVNPDYYRQQPVCPVRPARWLIRAT